jgi:hypothetical protein
MEFAEEVRALRENVKRLTARINRLEGINSSRVEALRDKNKRFIYRPQDKERSRLINRDEILTLLLQLRKTKEELIGIANYKNLLQEELRKINYNWKLNFICINEFLAKNKVPLLEMDDDKLRIKNDILILVEDRNKAYQENKQNKDAHN